MTSKLKCPICGGNIQYNDGYSTYDCKNNPAIHNASEEIWQALIQAKQDLEIARKALEYYANSRFGKKQDDGTYVLEIDKGCGVTVVYTYDPRPAKQALEQIEYKE